MTTFSRELSSPIKPSSNGLFPASLSCIDLGRNFVPALEKLRRMSYRPEPIEERNLEDFDGIAIS